MKRRKSDSKQSFRHVTLAHLGKAIIYCFLCGDELCVKTDKNQKFYVICNACGLQAFIRGVRGIQNLERLISVLREQDFVVREHVDVLHKIQAILAEIVSLEKEIEMLDSKLDIFASKAREKNKVRMHRALNDRIDSQLRELERIAHS